ncbi:MAG: outer membrane protein assembly factor BamA [Candidatus Dadabacteria bacterium]|nr:MAG: outer membrane protein assembly factor BamA [Candidatus Dadabacteria bacterium]
MRAGRLGRMFVVLAAVLAARGAFAAQRIAEVRVDGNERVETSAIRAHVHVGPGQVLDRRLIDKDVKEIYQLGFFDHVWVTAEDGPAGVILTYHVAERPYVTDVVFHGVKHVEKEDLEGVVGIVPGAIFDPRRAWEGLEAARKFYGSEGYPDARIEYSLERREGNTAVVHYHIKEGKLVRIREIRLEGVKAFKKSKLRKLMTTRERWFLSFLTGAGILNEDELKTDVDRLTAYYYDHGYIHVRIDEPKIERVGDGLVVTIKIDEGPLFHVGDISFEGDVLIEEDRLRSMIGFRPGDVFRASALRDAIFAVTEAYGDLGYAFAEAIPDTRVREAARRVDVVFRIKAGPVVTIRRIEIRGNTKTRDYVIRRELELHEGEKFSGSGLRRSKANVRRLGFFDEVELTTSRTDREDQVDLIVKVVEGRTGSFAAGAGFSSADRFLFNARIAEQNLFGRGQRLIFNADFGQIRQNFQFSFTEPWFANRPLSLGFDVFDWSLEFDRFRRGGRGFSVRASYPLADLGLKSFYGRSLERVRAGLEYRLERARIDGLGRFAPPDVVAEEGTRLTSSITPKLIRNTLDHPFDPTRGSRQVFSAEFAGLGGETDFVKVELSSRWFFPIGKLGTKRTVVYSVGGNLGYGLGDSGRSGKELPVFERYFPGGINSVRGFETRSLGPTQEVCDTTGATCVDSETGGSQQLIFNNELIVPLIPDAGIKGVVFFDAGNAFLAEDGIDFTGLRYAVGWGLRWLSPFGPLRIEVGYPLDRRKGESSSVVLFSFGAPL